MAILTVFQNDRALFAHDDELFVCAWRNAPTIREMRALGDEGRRVAATAGPACGAAGSPPRPSRRRRRASTNN